jgi:PPM family protein phosphatase
LLRAFGISDKGHVRPTNEDRFVIDDALGLCVVADGLGGHNAGEVAARMAIDAVVDYVRAAQGTTGRADEPAGSPDRRDEWPFGYDHALSAEANVLRTAIHLANMQILEAAITGPAYAGMGTTIVAARALNGRLIVAHVGDSRLYVLDGVGLQQITDDDSWLASVLAQDPTADRAALQHHPMRNALTNVVGARAQTEVHVVERTLTNGDLLLLTTDGVHGVLDEARLTALLSGETDLQVMTGQVIAAALARGSKDNCTAVVARYHASI